MVAHGQAVASPAQRGQWFRGIGAAMDGVFTLWYRDLLRFVRDRSRIVASLAQPLLFLVVFGTGLRSSMSRFGGQSGINYTEFIFPGIVAMSVLFTSTFSAISVIWDREFGFIKEIQVAPIPRWSIVVGKALGGSTTAMMQGVLILIFAPFIGLRFGPVTIIALLVCMFVTAFALSAVGLLIAAQMHTMEGFQLVVNFLIMPMFFLSGALFPLTSLPAWLAVLTHVDPVSYAVDGIRQVVLGSELIAAAHLRLTLGGQTFSTLTDMTIVLGFGAVVIALAVWRFSREE